MATRIRNRVDSNQSEIPAKTNSAKIDPAKTVLESARNQKILREIQGINNKVVQNRLHQTPRLKISYCTTCFNRFWQLSRILRPNLEQVKDDPDVEFVVVDFRGADSQTIHDFIVEKFPSELTSGRLKYYRRRADIEPFEWNVAIAKNVAHRLATGDVLVNLDGDNFIQKHDSRIIRYYFNQIPNLLFHQNWCNMALINMLKSLRLNPSKFDVQSWVIFPTNRGTFGRISMTRKDFMRLGGYNEQMINMGNQDTDLIFRALNSKAQYLVSTPRSDGSPKASIMNNTDIKPSQLKHNRQLTLKAFRNRDFIVNRSGFKEDLGWYESSGRANTESIDSSHESVPHINTELSDINKNEPPEPIESHELVNTELFGDIDLNSKHKKSRGPRQSKQKCPHCGDYHSDDEL